MTDTAQPDAAPIKPTTPSLWEDVIDIFYQPSAVFERRRNGSAWFPFLFVVICIALISYFTYSAIEPAIEAEMRRTMTASMAKNPQMTQEMMEKAISMQSNVARYVVGIGIAVAIFIVGLLTWLISKIFGAVETFGQAMLIASYAYFPRLLGSILGAVIALTTDPARMTGAAVMSVGPAHFMDPEKSNPFLLALAQRADFMILWETALLGIGVAVLGKLPRDKATIFAILMWILGGLWQFRTAYLAS